MGGGDSAGVDAAGIGAETRANVELFDFDASGPAAVDDVVSAMKAAAPFVDGFTGWSFTNTSSLVVQWTAPADQRIAHAELLATTASGTTRYAGWNSGAGVATITVPADPAATYAPRTRSAAGDRSASVRVTVAAL